MCYKFNLYQQTTVKPRWHHHHHHHHHHVRLFKTMTKRIVTLRRASKRVKAITFGYYMHIIWHARRRARCQRGLTVTCWPSPEKHVSVLDWWLRRMVYTCIFMSVIRRYVIGSLGCVNQQRRVLVRTVAYLRGPCAWAPLWCEKFFRHFITNKLKKYEFMLC